MRAHTRLPHSQPALATDKATRETARTLGSPDQEVKEVHTHQTAPSPISSAHAQPEQLGVTAYACTLGGPACNLFLLASSTACTRPNFNQPAKTSWHSRHKATSTQDHFFKIRKEIFHLTYRYKHRKSK